MLGQSWYYNDDPGAYGSYGRLYTFEGAQTACAQLGDCWRVPTEAEWTALLESYPDAEAAYAALIEGGSSGFEARLGGFRHFNGGFFELGVFGMYWSSTEMEIASISLWFKEAQQTVGTAFTRNDGGISCRCIKD